MISSSYVSIVTIIMPQRSCEQKKDNKPFWHGQEAEIRAQVLQMAAAPKQGTIITLKSGLKLEVKRDSLTNLLIVQMCDPPLAASCLAPIFHRGNSDGNQQYVACCADLEKHYPSLRRTVRHRFYFMFGQYGEESPKPYMQNMKASAKLSLRQADTLHVLVDDDLEQKHRDELKQIVTAETGHDCTVMGNIEFIIQRAEAQNNTKDRDALYEFAEKMRTYNWQAIADEAAAEYGFIGASKYAACKDVMQVFVMAYARNEEGDRVIHIVETFDADAIEPYPYVGINEGYGFATCLLRQRFSYTINPVSECYQAVRVGSPAQRFCRDIFHVNERRINVICGKRMVCMRKHIFAPMLSEVLRDAGVDSATAGDVAFYVAALTEAGTSYAKLLPPEPRIPTPESLWNAIESKKVGFYNAVQKVLLGTLGQGTASDTSDTLADRLYACKEVADYLLLVLAQAMERVCANGDIVAAPVCFTRKSTSDIPRYYGVRADALLADYGKFSGDARLKDIADGKKWALVDHNNDDHGATTAHQFIQYAGTMTSYCRELLRNRTLRVSLEEMETTELASQLMTKARGQNTTTALTTQSGKNFKLVYNNLNEIFSVESVDNQGSNTLASIFNNRSDQSSSLDDYTVCRAGLLQNYERLFGEPTPVVGSAFSHALVDFSREYCAFDSIPPVKYKHSPYFDDCIMRFADDLKKCEPSHDGPASKVTSASREDLKRSNPDCDLL
jgi:hypothetical protein